jgi:uncharacterized protein
MKTANTIMSKVFLTIALFSALLTQVSCQDKKSTTTAKAGVSAPSMDIHSAVVAGNVDVIRQHIAAGSNINEKDPFGGSSPLISAAVFGKTEIAKMLIDAGADVNFQNNEGSTALHSAAFFCRPEIVKMLLAKNADKTIKNKYNSTALESITPPFAEAKPIYDMMVNALGPMGLKLDYTYLEKTRPEIAALLK